MNLLARRRGVFWIVYLFFKGVMRGDPISIGIAVVLALGIVGWIYFKSRSSAVETSSGSNDFRPPGSDPSRPH